jgi:hypothetical protein
MIEGIAIMADTRATDLNAGSATVLDWIKSNRLVVLAGALTTIFGLIVSAANVAPLILKGLNVPDCLTYATSYHKPGSYFKNDGDFWHEYPPDGGAYQFEFREVQRTREFIDLLNLTERPDERDWKTLVVRLPACGGTAKLLLGEQPQRTIVLAEVWREQ